MVYFFTRLKNFFAGKVGVLESEPGAAGSVLASLAALFWGVRLSLPLLLVSGVVFSLAPNGSVYSCEAREPQRQSC